MIKESLKRSFLSGTVLYDSYIGLATTIYETNGTITCNEVPLQNTYGQSTGYKRYYLGDKLTYTSNKAEAYNNATLYFDEALADWGVQVNYFVIFSHSTATGTSYIRAWGRIVDEWGNPTSMTITKNQLPIIRANQLRMALEEVERSVYTLTFDMNGHGTQIAPMANLYCMPAVNTSVVEYSPNTFRPTEAGFAFAGWYKEASLTTKAVAKTDLAGNTTIYAKWVQGFSVTYEINGHGTQPANLVDQINLPEALPVLTADGFVFGGWYTDAELTTAAVAGATITQATTLYAKWTETTTE